MALKGFFCVYNMWGQWHSRDWLFTELPGGQGQSMLSFNYPKTLGELPTAKLICEDHHIYILQKQILLTSIFRITLWVAFNAHCTTLTFSFSFWGCY